MAEISPKAMLAYYRQMSPQFDNEQAAMFKALALKDRLELLFYMQLYANKTMAFLHNKIDPGAVEISGMPEPERGH